MSKRAEIQAGIRSLSRDDRDLLMTWMLESYFGDAAVAESAVAYRPETPDELLSFEQFVALTESSPIRYEYVGGYVYAQSGESFRHNRIVSNLVSLLHPHLRGKPCQLFHSGVYLQLRADNEDACYCPDVMVLCGPRDPAGRIGTDARLVVEVLSPSTERIDCREKRSAYQQMSELQEYVLIAQHTARITVYRRADGWRPLCIEGVDGALQLQSVEASLPLRTVYEGVFE